MPHIAILLLYKPCVVADPQPHMFQAVKVGEQIGIFALGVHRLGPVWLPRALTSFDLNTCRHTWGQILLCRQGHPSCRNAEST
jgi:hypothetical protein